MVAPANVTGNYFQIVGTAVPAGMTPRIRVRIAAPAVTTDEIVSMTWKEFTPSGGGAFTLPLIPNDQMRPIGTSVTPFYVVEFDAADAGNNFRSSPERYELSVPTGGGPFMDLVNSRIPGGQIEVTNEGSRPTEEYAPGVIILDVSGDRPTLSYTV